MQPEECGFVYFITDEAERGPIKVGYAKNVEQRLAELQTGNPERLKVIGRFPGPRWYERRYHDLLRSLRLTGEWFQRRPIVVELAVLAKRGYWDEIAPPPFGANLKLVYSDDDVFETETEIVANAVRGRMVGRCACFGEMEAQT